MTINKTLIALAMGLALAALSDKEAAAGDKPKEAAKGEAPADTPCANDQDVAKKNAP